VQTTLTAGAKGINHSESLVPAFRKYL